MSEVELTCLGDTAHIHDLGLRMVRGARVMTTLSAIANSRDLEFAKAQGLVSVRVMKAQTIKREDLPVMPTRNDPSPNHRAISRSAHHPAAPAIPREGPEGPSISLLRDLLQEIRGLREDLKKRPVPEASNAQTQQMAVAVAEAVRGALGGLRLDLRGGSSSTVLGVAPGEPEERFIPHGIVTGTAKAEIATVRAVAPSTSGLDDASTALRDARRVKKDDGEQP